MSLPAHLRRALLAVLLFAGTQTANAAPQRQGTVLPPACQTTTQIENAPLDRAWVVVVNFRVSGAACVLVYDHTTPTGTYLNYKVVQNACLANGNVQFSNGKATFNGGYIACTLNIMNEVNSMVSASNAITESQQPSGFYMLGRGVAATPPNASVPGTVLSYDATNPGFAPVALRLNANGAAPSTTAINATFNGGLFGQTTCAVPQNGAPQAWVYTYATGNLKFWSGTTEVCPLPRAMQRVRLWLNGGTLYIGGKPGGMRFYGTLDEVVIDPQGGTSPPKGG
jgi:hypothetical protein